MLASRRDHDAMIESSQQLAVLEERRKIARDLHDSVTQILFSLNLMSQSISSDAPVPGETVEKLQSLSRRGLQEMRSLLEELRPVSIDAKPMSLGQKIASYAADVVGLPAFTLDDQSYEAQDASVENQFLGIAQEALNNVAKHSKAGHVSLLLQTDPAGCLLKIEDDGEGFSESSCKSGHGLNTMRERAGEIQAKLEIQSEPGKGTVIQLVRGRGQNGNSNRNRRRP
jgi:signal transduction histidine kinase